MLLPKELNPLKHNEKQVAIALARIAKFLSPYDIDFIASSNDDVDGMLRYNINSMVFRWEHRHDEE